uniref:Uncharacterized protein n=1 Tax=Lotharella oceanica TaxID=641309 RepID=A0A7S2TZM0_9EUKA
MKKAHEHTLTALSSIARNITDFLYKVICKHHALLINSANKQRAKASLSKLERTLWAIYGGVRLHWMLMIKQIANCAAQKFGKTNANIRKMMGESNPRKIKKFLRRWMNNTERLEGLLEKNFMADVLIELREQPAAMIETESAVDRARRTRSL